MGTRIGQMPCLNPECSCTDMSVEVTGAGTWQAKCHKCGFPTFGKAGTRWRRHMEAMTTLDEDAKPAPAPAPTPAAKPEPTEPTPKPRPARSVFDLATLK